MAAGYLRRPRGQARGGDRLGKRQGNVVENRLARYDRSDVHVDLDAFGGRVCLEDLTDGAADGCSELCNRGGPGRGDMNFRADAVPAAVDFDARIRAAGEPIESGRVLDRSGDRQCGLPHHSPKRTG